MKNIAPGSGAPMSDGAESDVNQTEQSPASQLQTASLTEDDQDRNASTPTPDVTGLDNDIHQRRDLLDRVEAALDGKVMLTEQAMIDGLDLLADLLQREHSCLGSAASIADYISRATCTDRLPELVNVVCVKYETQTRVWLKRVVALRELLGQFCDLVDNRLKEDGIVGRSFPSATTVDSSMHDAENEASMLARVVDARLSVGRAAARLAKSEEQAAKLEHDANEAAYRAVQVANVARETKRRLADAAEAEDRKRQEDKEKAEKEERERRTMLEKEEAERKKASAEQERNSMKKQSPGVEDANTNTNDISTWPLFVYSVDPGDTGIGLGCVVRARPGQLSRDDITVSRIEQLDWPLSLGPGEELVSNIVEIRSPSNDVDKNCVRELNPPAAVALPYINQRSVPSRESIVMVTTTGEENDVECMPWAETTTREVMFDDIRDYKFVEMRIGNLKPGVRLAVVSRFKREIMSVCKRSLRVCSSADPRVGFTFDPTTLTTKKAASFMVEVTPIDLLSVQDVKHRFPETCERLVAVSPMIRLSAANTAVTLQSADSRRSGFSPEASLLPQTLARQPVVISLPVPPNPAKLRRPATSVTDSRSTNAAAGGGEGYRTGGLSTVSRRSDQASAARPKTAAATFFQSVKDEVAEDTVTLLVKDDADHADKWSVMPNVKAVPIKNTDVINFALNKIVKGRIIAVRNLVGGPPSVIESAIRNLELGLQETAVNAVLRHDVGDPTTATTQINVHFVPPGSVNRTAKKLADDGYPNGPPAGPDMMLREGQRLTVRFRGNICAADGSTEIRTVFNSNMRSKLDFRATVTDKFAQKSIEVYRGFVQIFTRPKLLSTIPAQHHQSTSTASARMFTAMNTAPPSGSSTDESKTRIVAGPLPKNQVRDGAVTFDESSETLLCELLVTIPKPDSETMRTIVSRAPVILHTEGVVDVELLRHLATEIGNEWRHVAHLLGIRRVRLQAILRNHNGPNETQQTVYEMLMSWMKKLPRSVNKACLLRTALLNSGRPDLAELIASRQQESTRLAACQSARGSTLRRAMVTVARHSDLLPDWESLCSLLGLDESDVDDIRYRHQGLRERCYESLTRWAHRQDDLGTTDEDQRRVGSESGKTVQGLIQLLRKGRHRELAVEDIAYQFNAIPSELERRFGTEQRAVYVAAASLATADLTCNYHGEVKVCLLFGGRGGTGAVGIPCFKDGAEPIDPAPLAPKSWRRPCS